MRGARLCVGCLVVFPAFLLLLPFEALVLGAIGWQAAFLMGIATATAQGVSALGWTRRRWIKILVKTCLGAGLALFLIGIRAAPWPIHLQAGVIGAMLALALLSTMPRKKRIAAVVACTQAKDA